MPLENRRENEELRARISNIEFFTDREEGKFGDTAPLLCLANKYVVWCPQY